MLVVDLHCDHDHAFEGWFASGDELARQQQAGLLACPVCGSHAVQRRPSVPRLNVSGVKDGPLTASSPGPAAPVEVAAPAAEAAQALQAAYLHVVRQLIQQTENVGERFADEARRIHHGDAPERAIRGQATAEQRAELREEGIDTLALPVPKGLDGPVQ